MESQRTYIASFLFRFGSVFFFFFYFDFPMYICVLLLPWKPILFSIRNLEILRDNPKNVVAILTGVPRETRVCFVCMYVLRRCSCLVGCLWLIRRSKKAITLSCISSYQKYNMLFGFLSLSTEEGIEDLIVSPTCGVGRCFFFLESNRKN